MGVAPCSRQASLIHIFLMDISNCMLEGEGMSMLQEIVFEVALPPTSILLYANAGTNRLCIQGDSRDQS